MNKIKVLNVKTGKVSIMTKFAVDQLKKGGHFKNFEILSDKPAPVAPKPVVAEEVVEDTFVDGAEETTDEPSETKRSYRKRKEQ
jgi:hypothetical protein